MGDRVAVLKDGLLQQVDSPAQHVRPPGQPLRRRLHRLPGDEPGRGADHRRRREVRQQRRRRSTARRSRPPPTRATRTVTVGVRPEHFDIVEHGGAAAKSLSKEARRPGRSGRHRQRRRGARRRRLRLRLRRGRRRGQGPRRPRRRPRGPGEGRRAARRAARRARPTSSRPPPASASPTDVAHERPYERRRTPRGAAAVRVSRAPSRLRGTLGGVAKYPGTSGHFEPVRQHRHSQQATFTIPRKSD